MVKKTLILLIVSAIFYSELIHSEEDGKFSYTTQNFDEDDKSCPGILVQNEAVNLDNARDQDTIGWCYAYSASDLLSFHLGQRISAVSLYDSHLSIEASIKSQTDIGGAGFLAVEKYLKKNKGFCLEKDLPSSDFKFCADMNYRSFLVMFFDEIKKQRVNDLMKNNRCFSESVDAAFPQLGPERLKQYLDQDGTQFLIERIFDFHCKEHHFQNFKPKFEHSNDLKFSKIELLKKIHQELDSKRIIEIGYQYSILNGEKNSLPKAHSSVVMGRRKNKGTGKCEFLIRNSWGKTCIQNEDQDLNCHKNCDSFGCRPSGHFWVSEDRLSSALSNVTRLTND